MAPYDSEGDVLSEYFGPRVSRAGPRRVVGGDEPTVPISATDPLRGATITEYTARVNPSLSVAETSLREPSSTRSSASRAGRPPVSTTAVSFTSPSAALRKPMDMTHQ